MSENKTPAMGMSTASAVSCGEVISELVAYQREELSPLRAETVRAHLKACDGCRDQAFELDLAARSLARLPEHDPPVDLLTRTLNRIRSSSADGASAPQPGCDDLQSQTDNRHVHFLFRPVRSKLARFAVAAGFLIMALALGNHDVAEVIGKAQLKLMGPELSRALDEATQNFLMQFFL